MHDTPPPPPETAPPSAVAPNSARARRRIPLVGRWLAELALVFLGAYAAFWLSNYQERQQEKHRHQQILAALEHEVTDALQSAKAERTRQAERTAEFRRALEAGEMPPLRTFTYASDYSPTDAATLLQSGGYQLLDVKTLLALRAVESTMRSAVNMMTHAEKLSDELILPNLDQDISFFYDPATKQLRKRFARYADALDGFVGFFDEYIQAETELLKQIQAERQRR